MGFATLTTHSSLVAPLVDFTQPHSFRCLTGNQGRVVEFLEPVHIPYRKGVPFMICQIVDDNGTTKYMDTNGWMFDGATLHDLMIKQKLRTL